MSRNNGMLYAPASITWIGKPKKYPFDRIFSRLEWNSRQEVCKVVELNNTSPDGDIICFYCKCVLTNYLFAYEHKLPKSRGGLFTVSNITISCTSCNSRKGTKTLNEYYDWLKRRGEKPLFKKEKPTIEQLELDKQTQVREAELTQAFREIIKEICPNRFKTGQRVLHQRFGYGIVISSKVRGDDEEVDVIFENGIGVKRLSGNIANLTVFPQSL